MTVRDFMEYSSEESFQNFTIYDLDTDEEVFTGTTDECIDDYLDATVESFDVIDETSPRLVFNVTL